MSRRIGGGAPSVPGARGRAGLGVVLAVVLGAVSAGAAAPALFETPPQALAGREPGADVWHLAPGLTPAAWRAGDRWTVPGNAAARTLVIDDVREVRGGDGAGSGWVRVRAHPEGEPGAEIRLVLDGETAVATWRTARGELSRILPAGGRRHRWTDAPPETGPACGNGAEGAPVGGAAPGAREAWARRLLSNGSAPAGEPGTTNELDIAFFFTPAAEAGAGGLRGIEALVEMTMWESNDAYERSATGLRLRRVACRRVAYVESGDLAGDLGRFTRNGDGVLDEVHRVRDEVAADVACLIVESEASNRYAGMANGLGGLDAHSLAQGFTACLRPYLVGNYTVAHEVGHLLGCAHDRENAGGTGLEPWSYGTRLMVDGLQYRTVMAYRPGRQCPHFSNPHVLFRGVPTGVAEGVGAADNARTIRRVAPLLAAVRTPRLRVGFARADETVSERAGRIRVAVLREGAAGPATCRWRSLDGTATWGTDFLGEGGEVRFVGDGTQAEIELEILDNSRPEGSRHWTLQLESPGVGSALGPITELRVTIADDELDGSAPLDARLRTVPGADHGVLALVRDGEGRVYLGGAFGSVGDRARARLARLLPDGRVDEAYAPEVKYQVGALALLPEGRLAIGGEFNTVNGIRLNHVAVLGPDGTPDARFEFDTGTDWPVHALLGLPDGRLVIAGRFTSVQGSLALRTARLLPTGAVDATYGSRTGPDGDVLALARDSVGRIYLGGRFGTIGGRARPGVGRLSPEGSPDPAYAPDGVADGPVQALWLDEQGRLWVGGGFRRFLGVAASGLARLSLDGRRDAEFVSGTGVNDDVLAFAPAGDGRVWIAGRFTEVQGRRRNRIARLLADGSLDAEWDPGLGANDAVLALTPTEGGGVVAGGMFTEVNGVARGGIAALLPDNPDPARILGGWQSGGRIVWETRVAPGQVLAVESTSDGGSWREIGEVRTGTDPTRLEVLNDGWGSRWFRLRRKLE